MKPGTEIGNYTLEERLGRGGMGLVFLARDGDSGRRVALKVLQGGGDESAWERFGREVRVMRSIRHPNIVSALDFGVYFEHLYVVMPLVRGATMAEALAAGTLKLGRGIAVLLKVARALHVAHEAGVLHRDVKPANILLDEESGEPLLSDFGLARLQGDGKELTAVGMTMGTPEYMSPEQALGYVDEVDARSDVYALGTILYQLLTHRTPFSGPSPTAVMVQVATGKVAPPTALNPRVPEELERVCLRALEREKTDRHSSAEAFANDLGLAYALVSWKYGGRRPGP